MTDITQAAVSIIESVYSEQIQPKTTACHAILLDWADIPQQPNELCVFGESGASRSRPNLPSFVSRLSIFKTDVGMVCDEFGKRRLLDN
jgi:hypothetical protein